MNYMTSADLEPRVSRNVAGLAVGNALRRFVGRGRAYSVKELANATRLKDRVIECAMCHPEDPEWRRLSIEALFSLADELGPEFTSEALKPTSQAAYSTRGVEPPEPCELVAECASDTAEVARAAADKRFTVRERQALAAIGQRHVERGRQLVALGALA